MVSETDTKHLIVQWLVAEQKRRGLRNQQFADLLGIRVGTWSPTKSGHKAVGVKVARAALRFPEIAPLAMAVLLHDDTDSTVSATVHRRRRAA